MGFNSGFKGLKQVFGWLQGKFHAVRP